MNKLDGSLAIHLGSQDSNESVLGSELQPNKHDETIVYK